MWVILYSAFRYPDPPAPFSHDRHQSVKWCLDNAISARVTTPASVQDLATGALESNTAKELENTLVSLSRDLEGHQRRIGETEAEKKKFEGRVKELESTVRATIVSPAVPSSRPRNRSSSISDLRITTLENELAELRRTSGEPNNDQKAPAARLNNRVAELESLLADREEELQCFQEQGGPGGCEREELLKLIDEDEAKIQASERLVGDANDLPVLKQKLKDCEEMLKSESLREKEEVLDELIEARDIISGLETHHRTLSSDLQKLKGVSTPLSSPDKESLDNIERLLGAVDRLQGERDDLRRDNNIQFLDIDTSPDLHPHDDVPLIRVTPCANEQSNAAWITTELKEVERLHKLVLGCGLVIGNLESERTVTQAQADSFHNAYTEKASSLTLVEERLREAESRLTTTIQLLFETTAQRNDTMSRLSVLGAEWRLKNDNANLEQHDLTSERDSLNVQVTDLTSDIASARQELSEAESRYTQLQFHQLSDMPSTQATKALRSQIEELECRILRRTEQIGVQQHDIRKLETNLRLQEERLTEMTTEMEMIVAQKDAMVEDCADAREQRDEAIMNVERLEEKVERLESLLEDRSIEQEAIIEVMFLNSARNKEKMNVETGQIKVIVKSLNEALEDARERLRSLEQDAKRVTESLASSWQELASNVMSTHDLEQVNIDLAGRVQQLEDQLQSRVAEVATLASQLDSLDITRSSLSSKESEYRVALEALQQQISQKDQLLADSDLEGELVQLTMKQIEDLAQLQSRLVQATSNLDELQARYVSAQVEHEQSLADTSRVRARLEQQLEETSHELVLLKEMKESLEAASRQQED
ncbi:hypothetical protein EV360DRAFT_88027 [Lentinula raphanica]|nr:hypothetical protein EV360DRAFT_88027 [Lentinula raphanica]